LKSEISDHKASAEALEKLLMESRLELAHAIETQDEKGDRLRDTQEKLKALEEEHKQLHDELAQVTSHRNELEVRSISRQDFDDLQLKTCVVEGLYSSLASFFFFLLLDC
jgi:NTP pyrophosphatase (non-canonical NTP hydrolase)